jgi:hypothetical protein
VRQAEDQLDLPVERPAKYPAAKFPVWSFPAILFYQMHASTIFGSIEMIALPSKGMAVLSGGNCMHADWCMYHAYSGIKFYSQRSMQHNKHSMNAVAAVEKASFQGKVAEDAWRATELTTVLRGVAVMSPTTFALDEVSRGIRHAFATSTVPIWSLSVFKLFWTSKTSLVLRLIKPAKTSKGMCGTLPRCLSTTSNSTARSRQRAMKKTTQIEQSQLSTTSRTEPSRTGPSRTYSGRCRDSTPGFTRIQSLVAS